MEQSQTQSEGGFLEGSLRDFLDRLASASPVPGGGSVAALAGALAVGLVSMVASLTVSSPRCTDVHPQAKVLLGRSEALREELQDLIQEDADAFAAVGRALKLPKETEDQKRARQEGLQQALLGAMKVPIEVARRAEKVAELACEVAEIGNVNAVSDAGVAALLAEAAARAAELNVAINAGLLKDRATAEVALVEMTALLERISESAARALDVTRRRMS